MMTVVNRVWLTGSVGKASDANDNTNLQFLPSHWMLISQTPGPSLPLISRLHPPSTPAQSVVRYEHPHTSVRSLCEHR
jgi:hypothetical protein